MLSGIMTLAAMLAFFGVILWTFDGRNRARFDQAARAPLDDEGKGERG